MPDERTVLTLERTTPTQKHLTWTEFVHIDSSTRIDGLFASGKTHEYCNNYFVVWSFWNSTLSLSNHIMLMRHIALIWSPRYCIRVKGGETKPARAANCNISVLDQLQLPLICILTSHNWRFWLDRMVGVDPFSKLCIRACIVAIAP